MQSTWNTSLLPLAYGTIVGPTQDTRPAELNKPSELLFNFNDHQSGLLRRTAANGSHPQPTSPESIASESEYRTFSPTITNLSWGHYSNPASFIQASVFNRGADGLPILLNALTPQAPRNDPGPAFCGTHILSRPPSAGSSENQPPPLPNREQTSPSQDELGFRNQIARLNPDMKVFVKFHGGTSLRNKESVLALIEKWNKEHREKLIQVERKDGKKSGVIRVICGICRKEYPTIQKAAEHITSEHWGLNIWECDECRKSYRRRQELQAHRKKHDKKTAMQADGSPTSYDPQQQYPLNIIPIDAPDMPPYHAYSQDAGMDPSSSHFGETYGIYMNKSSSLLAPHNPSAYSPRWGGSTGYGNFGGNTAPQGTSLPYGDPVVRGPLHWHNLSFNMASTSPPLHVSNPPLDNAYPQDAGQLNNMGMEPSSQQYGNWSGNHLIILKLSS